jgi:DNA-binding SARP family transcriptional activator
MQGTEDACPPLMRIFTFGGIVLEQLISSPADPTPRYQRIPHEVWQSRGPALTMLKFLISRPVLAARQATQEAIIDAIWTEAEQQRMGDVEKALKAAASVLRKVLTPEGSSESLLLMIPGTGGESTIYKLVGQDRLWIDADHFEWLVARAIRTPAIQVVLPLWQEASDLYRGVFLDSNRYQDWSQARRESLHADYRRLVLYMADLYLRTGEVQKAGELLEPFVALHPTDEDALGVLMSVLEHQEQYHAAWRHYRRARGQEAQQDQQISHRLHTIAKRIREHLLTPAQPLQVKAHIDWGDAPHAQNLYGRTKELSTLSAWIVQEHARLVVVVGMAGIGKTSLVVSLVEAVKSGFEYVLWRSLQTAPPLQTALEQCLACFSQEQATEMPQDEENQIALLLSHLRQHRCLLILDSMESLFQPGTYAGTYREGYAGYGTLLSRLGEARHQSCVLLISRELPRNVALLEGKHTAVHVSQLGGLQPEDGIHLLKEKGVIDPDEVQQAIVRLYEGNPLLLILVAQHLRDLYGAVCEPFADDGVMMTDEMQAIFDQQFEHLSETEQVLLLTIAKEPDTVTLTILQERCADEQEKRAIPTALRSLQWRSFVKMNATGVILSKVLMTYLLERSTQIQRKQITVDTITGPTSIPLAPVFLANQQHDPLPDFSHAATRDIIQKTARELEGIITLNLSRRHLLQQAPPFLLGIASATLGVPDVLAYAPATEETLSFYSIAIPACWSLVYNGGIEYVEMVLPAYLTHLTTLTQQSPHYRKQAAHLASQGYKLTNLLDLRREDFGLALQHSKDAFLYGQIAEDPHLQIAALIEEALTFWYRKRYAQTLTTYQQALHLTDHIKEVSPIIKGRVYAGLAVAYAVRGQEQDALRYIGLASDTFPDRPEHDPHFSYTHYGHYYLHLYKGLMYTRLGQTENALAAYAHFQGPEYVSRRTEIANREAAALLALGDLERCNAKIEEAVALARSTDSDLRYSEAREIYQGMQVKWPHEQSVQALAGLF